MKDEKNSRWNSRWPTPEAYRMPDDFLDTHISELAREWGVPPEAVAEAKASAYRNIHNEILQAAGSSVTADDRNVLVELWAIAGEVGIQKEFDEDKITPLGFLTKVKRHFQSQQSKEIVLDPARRRTKKRGAKPSPELEKARAGLRSILEERKFAEADAKTIISEADGRGVPCPYGANWGMAFAKHSSTISSLISREKDRLHNLHNSSR